MWNEEPFAPLKVPTLPPSSLSKRRMESYTLYKITDLSMSGQLRITTPFC